MKIICTFYLTLWHKNNIYRSDAVWGSQATWSLSLFDFRKRIVRRQKSARPNLHLNQSRCPDHRKAVIADQEIEGRQSQTDSNGRTEEQTSLRHAVADEKLRNQNRLLAAKRISLDSCLSVKKPSSFLHFRKLESSESGVHERGKWITGEDYFGSEIKNKLITEGKIVVI